MLAKTYVACWGSPHLPCPSAAGIITAVNSQAYICRVNSLWCFAIAVTKITVLANNNIQQKRIQLALLKHE